MKTNLIFARIFLATTLLLSAVTVANGMGPAIVLVAGAGLMLLDAVINDLLPERFSACFLSSHRSHIYTAVAAVCIAALMPVGGDAGWGFAALFAQATAACALAIADTYTRYVQPRKHA